MLQLLSSHLSGVAWCHRVQPPPPASARPRPRSQPRAWLRAACQHPDPATAGDKPLELPTNLHEVAQCPEKALLEQLRSIKMLNRIFNMVSMGHLFVKTITDGRL